MERKIKYEYVPCDLCGSLDFKIRYTKSHHDTRIDDFDYPVVECRSCGLVFVNPRPNALTMQHFYPSNYHVDARTRKRLSDRYNNELKFLPELTNEKVLDIGCAEGEFLENLKKKYNDTVCVGTDLYFNPVVPSWLEFYNKDILECNFDDNEFDIITAWAVFEHLHQPALYFKEVHRILKKGKKFIFLVTNSESLYGKKAYKETIPRHLYHFSEPTLRAYADKFGFKFNCIHYDDSICDGRGHGTIKYSLLKILLRTRNWRKLNSKPKGKLGGLLYKQCIKLGSVIDNVIFKIHWEARAGKSGIIIAEFEKL